MYYLPNSTVQHSQIKKRGRGSVILPPSPQTCSLLLRIQASFFFFVPPVTASHIFQNYVSHFQGQKKS